PSVTTRVAPNASDPTGPRDGDFTTGEHGDGRTRRRRNSYERAVDALLDLIESGNEAPTAQQIAERSGISVRTVFRLTEDIESLHAAAVLRQMNRTAHLYIALPGTGPLRTRLGLLVKNRVTVFESIAPVRRVGDRLAANSTRIAEGLELHHMVLRTQVAEVFERELQRLPRPRRVTALDAIDVAAGWETWEQLRRGKGLSVTSAARVMELLIAGALHSE
ncbi:MAG TPA: TetR/AcrR family transcriptional regulator, partial [Acidimicrobiales bacterium]|nr:TetR/AcrR family transcriptional regulator [Acidimicrobiales bacterium]